MRRLHWATLVVEAVEFLRRFLFTVVLVLFAGSRSEGMTELFLAGTGALTVAFSGMRYFTTRYGLDGDTLIIRSGLIWKQDRTIPLARVQNVNLRRTLLHRLFGVAQVDVETASGQQADARLSVLSLVDAQELKELLLGHREAPSFEIADVPSSLFKVEMRDLVLAGAFQNRSLYMIGAVLGLLQGPDLVGFARRISGPATQVAKSMGVGFAVMAGFALFLFGWLVSIAGTVTKYHGFHIVRHDKGLKVGFGLVTLIEHVIPLKRVQFLRVVQPLLYRWMRLCEMDVATAGSFGEKEGGATTKLAPVVRLENAPRLSRHVFADLRIESIEWRQVSPLTVRRSFLALTWVCLAAGGASTMPYGPRALLALPVLLGLAWAYARKRHQRLGYALQDGFLCARSGVMRQTTVFVPLQRIQFAEVGSSWFQRRLGLATFELRTASAFATADATIPDLPADVARELQDAAVRRDRA